MTENPLDKGTIGQLTHFIIKPCAFYKDSDECYVAIMSTKDGDTIMFYHEGGVNVGDVDSKAVTLGSSHRHLPNSRKKLRRNFSRNCPLTAKHALQASSKLYSNSMLT